MKPTVPAEAPELEMTHAERDRVAVSSIVGWLALLWVVILACAGVSAGLLFFLGPFRGDNATLGHASAAEAFAAPRLQSAPQLDIAIGPSPSGVEGRISFFANSRTLMGSQDYVYLNRGSEDGLVVGSPLEVYRDGFDAHESARDEKVRVPERVVAQLLVLRAQPNSAVAVVRHTEEELALGDRFRGRTR